MMNATAIQALSTSLSHLAAPGSDQIDYLTSLGVADLIDELALEFDDCYRPIAQELDQVSPALAAACQELDRMLSNDQLGWTFADLDSADWGLIRVSAATAAALVRDLPGGSP